MFYQAPGAGRSVWWSPETPQDPAQQKPGEMAPAERSASHWLQKKRCLLPIGWNINGRLSNGLKERTDSHLLKQRVLLPVLRYKKIIFLIVTIMTLPC